jgi:hypothetical protein
MFLITTTPAMPSRKVQKYCSLRSILPIPIQFIPQRFQYLKVLTDMRLLCCFASESGCISQAKATRKIMFTVHFTGVRDNISLYTKAVQKVSVHFEYLENRSRGLDVTWQPVRRDLTAHP